MEIVRFEKEKDREFADAIEEWKEKGYLEGLKFATLCGVREGDDGDVMVVLEFTGDRLKSLGVLHTAAKIMINEMGF